MARKGKMFHNKQNKFTTIQFITHIIKQDKFIPNTYIIKNNTVPRRSTTAPRRCRRILQLGWVGVEEGFDKVVSLPATL
jgi:hypothetical protein